VEKQKELGEGNDEFGLTKYIFVHTSKRYLTCRNVLIHEASGFTSLPKEGVLRICIALKSPSLSGGIETVNLGSNDNQANHYATEDDW
jgi:hypothetical protein